MPTITLTSGKKFAAKGQQTLLDASAAAGFTLPHSCRDGRCGSCKALLKEGETRAITQEASLTAAELAEGWILTCLRSAETDVTLEVEDLGDFLIPQPRTLPCRIARIEKLASDVLHIGLRLPPKANFAFKPGQYVDVIGPDGVRRSYSLANSDPSDGILELHVKKVVGGAFSEYWFNNAQLHDLLRLHGPLGTFFLRDVDGKDVFFLATGTGIAPISSMLSELKFMAEKKGPRSVSILWGGRSPDDIYIDFQNFPTHYRFSPVLSRPPKTWLGETGYVQDVLLSEIINFNSAVVYACGLREMIEDARESLVSAGLPARNFFSDAFLSSG